MLRIITRIWAHQTAYTVTACTQRARKEVFACTKLRARKSVKIPLSSTWMLFKVAGCFCLKANKFGTIRSDIPNPF